MSLWCRALAVLTFAVAPALAPVAAPASPHEARVPLHDGKLDSAELSRTLLEDLHVRGVSLNVGSLDLSGWAGATFVRALDASLKDGCTIEVTPDALVLHFDPEKL